MKRNTPPRRNGEQSNFYSLSCLQIHPLQDLKDFFTSSYVQHSLQVKSLSLSCHSLRALEKEFSDHIHSISHLHFQLAPISGLIHHLHCNQYVLLLSISILGGFLTASGVKAEEEKYPEYDSSNFIVADEAYSIVQLKSDGNFWKEGDKNPIVATLTPGPGYKIARGESGNENEVYWFWLTNPSTQPISAKPSLTVNVKKGASFDLSGDKIKRSFTVGNHKLFYIDTNRSSTQNLLNEAQQKLVNSGDLYGEYVIDKGKYLRIIYRNKKGEEVDPQHHIIKAPVLYAEGKEISQRRLYSGVTYDLLLGYKVDADGKTITFAGTSVDPSSVRTACALSSGWKSRSRASRAKA